MQVMLRCKQLGCLKEQSNIREPLIHALEVSSPLTKTPFMDVMHNFFYRVTHMCVCHSNHYLK